MFYFSSILNTSVRNSEDYKVGKINDLVVKLTATEEGEYPLVVGVVVQAKKHQEVFVPSGEIEEWGRQSIRLRVSLEKNGTPFPTGDEYIYLKKTVLDKQIVDLSGARVVRVNDLQLSRVQELLRLISIDISTFALLRRFGVSESMIPNRVKPHLLEWKDVQIIGNKLQFATRAKEFTRLHPADIANLIEQLNVSRGSQLLQSLDKDIAARVLEEIQPNVKKLLVKYLGVERAASVMSRMSIDEIVDLIQLLPGKEAHAIIEKLPVDPSNTQKIEKILSYDEDTAGGLMTTEYLSAAPQDTVQSVIKKIKLLSDKFRSIQYIYIVDEEEKFLGVVSLRRLIIAEKDRTMKDILKPSRKIPTVGVERKLLSLATKMTKYDLSTIAVLGKNHKLVGVVTVDDIMRRMLPRA